MFLFSVKAYNKSTGNTKTTNVVSDSKEKAEEFILKRHEGLYDYAEATRLVRVNPALIRKE